jgi:hypothetical protein
MAERVFTTLQCYPFRFTRVKRLFGDPVLLYALAIDALADSTHQAVAQRGKRLEYFT